MRGGGDLQGRLLNDLSSVASSNSPAGGETPGQGDDHFRAGYSFTAQLRDKLNGTSDTGTVKNPVLSGTATGSLAGASLADPTITGTATFSGSAVTWSGNPTHSGNHAWSGNHLFNGAVTVGDAAGDVFNINSTTVQWNNFPVHTGAHTWLGTQTFSGLVQAGSLELGYRDIPRVTSGIERGKVNAVAAGFTINTGPAAGSTYSIYNDSAAAFTVTQGAGLTLRQAGSTSTGNRTLAARGIATVWFNSSSEAVISGAGVS
jgi:hypothetical protein